MTVIPAGSDESTVNVSDEVASSTSETETVTGVIGSLYCTVCDNRLIAKTGASFTAFTVTLTVAVDWPPCPSSIV